MSQSPSVPTAARANLVLAILFLGMFVFGSAELLVVGVLDLIAVDLRVGIPTAGGLTTAFAVGVAIGGPLLTALTIRYDRRLVLAGALTLFVIGNLVAVVTSLFWVFVAARVLTGAIHGLFIAAAFATAVAAVSPERAGRAISVVVSGVAVSAAVGVPLGTLLGQVVGWRGAFVAVVVAGVLALAATLAVVRPTPSSGAGATDQARHAFAPRVLAVLLLCALVFASHFAALTFIVPFLAEVTGISGAAVSVFLLAYGVATAIGSIVGGRLADRSAARMLPIAAAGAAVALLALYLVGTIVALTVVALLIWGVFAWSMAPSLQYRIVGLAGPGGQLAQSLPASAINIGIALGSLAGGAAIHQHGATGPILTGLAIAVIAVPVAFATGLLKAPQTTVAEPAPTGSGA
jgi:DHA1 family inner membrane transport protein